MHNLGITLRANHVLLGCVATVSTQGVRCVRMLKKPKGPPHFGTPDHLLCKKVKDLLDLPDYDSYFLSFRLGQIAGSRPSVRSIRRWSAFKSAPKAKGYPEAIQELWEKYYGD